MRRRTTSYDKSYVGSSGQGLKSGNLRKRARVAGKPRQIAAADESIYAGLLGHSQFLIDLAAEKARIDGIAASVIAGDITISEARAQLRGAA